MSIANSGNIGGIRPSIGQGKGSLPKGDLGASFQDALRSVQDLKTNSSSVMAPAIEPLKFSNHAISRMQHRGVRFEPDELQRIEGAVAKAKTKGAKETLVLTDKAAMVVSVKNNTVVTVMDKSSMKDNVFTKIDSTVVI